MLQANTNIETSPYQNFVLTIRSFETKAIETPAKTPIKLTTSFMLAADIDAFMELQKKIAPALAKPYHLKERSAEDLKIHIGERMPIIGVKNEEGVFIGQCLLSYLKNIDFVQNISGYPVAQNIQPVTAVLQSLCVDPDHKGKGISKLLLNTAFDCAAQNGMTQIISAIADDNHDSAASFKARGYKPFAHGTDAKGGYAKTYYRRTISCDAA